jgi:acyl-coenzyme A thioesterase PaaI-like protein
MSDTGEGNELWNLARSPDNICFACGPGNPIGLHLHLERQGETAVARFIPGELHGGWAGVVHGGILATVLDEVMAYAVFFTGWKCVTARMEVRYRAAVTCGDVLVAEARITRDTRRLVDVEATILRGDTVVAEANGRFMKLGPLDAASIASPRPVGAGVPDRG